MRAPVRDRVVGKKDEGKEVASPQVVDFKGAGAVDEEESRVQYAEARVLPVSLKPYVVAIRLG